MAHENIQNVVQRFKPLTMRDRTAALNRLIGQPSQDANVLHWRALLITALREAKLWPYEDAPTSTL